MKKFLLILTLLTPLIILSQSLIDAAINGEASDDQSGTSVSLSADGTIVAIGAPYNGSSKGHVRVYKNTGTWNQIGSDIDGEATDDQSGYSVSLSADGTTVAIGAPYNKGTGTDAGHVRIYKYNVGPNTWTQVGADIDAAGFNNYAGWSVSLSADGNTVAIGAYQNTSSTGLVRIYNFNITPPTPIWEQIGADIFGETTGNQSGWSVSLSDNGSTVAIGANFNAGANGTNSGHVRVYRNMSGTWTKLGNDIDGEAAFDQSGFSVSLSNIGNTVAIGATRNSGGGANSGHARVYSFNSTSWVPVGQDINGAAGDFSGWSVSLSDDASIVAVGARGTNSSAGQVRIYQNISNTWTQIGTDIDGEQTSDYSGSSISLSSDGHVIAIGSPGNDDSFDTAGQVRVFNLAALLSSDTFVLSRFEVYPNPVQDQFTIQLQDGLQLMKVNIYSQLGQFIKEETKATIDVSKFSKGLYLVEIITNKGKATKKVMIK